MEKTMRVQFIAVSQNAKTGPIPASIIERASCWPGCALYENGCYAETGALALHWDRVSQGVRGGSWSEFCTKVAALRPGRLWRYAQAGDLPGHGSKIDDELLHELVAANTGKHVIAFTHGGFDPWRTLGHSGPCLMAIGRPYEACPKERERSEPSERAN